MTQAKIETTLAERGQQAKPPEQTSGAGGKPMEQHAEPGADERAAFELPELPEPLEIDWPTLDAHALGCGVEDRGLRDRYDCANYGFETGVDKAASCVPNEIYDADQMREYAQAAVSAWQIRAAQSGQRAGVAEGFKIMPIEPTQAMIDAMGESVYGYPRSKAEEWAKEEKFESCAHVGLEAYRAAIAAAPAQQQEDAE